MEHTYWHKQTSKSPLFPTLLWSRPENRLLAGKLLIIGGNLHSFAAPATAYNAATTAGVGVAKILLPNDLKKTVGPIFEDVEFAPSTPSGSFNQKALAELHDLASWSDAVLLAGDFGRNSETAILLEKFVEKYKGAATITKDTVDYFTSYPSILNRVETTLVVNLEQLQKLAIAAKFTQAFTLGMDLLQIIDTLHTFTLQYPAEIVVKHLQNICVAVGGEVSTTKLEEEQPIWQVVTAARAATWRLQNPSQPFQALTTSLVTHEG